MEILVIERKVRIQNKGETKGITQIQLIGDNKRWLNFIEDTDPVLEIIIGIDHKIWFPVKWKFGDRVKVTKILVTIKHLTTQEVEEGEFDIEEIERELAEKRHYTSTNRWIPANDIKNGYVVGSMHTRLISDASALDYIVF